MNCLNCDGINFSEKKIRCSPLVKGEKFDVITESMVCENCGFEFMNDDQMCKLRKYSIDKYREKHGLLTSLQILKYRKELGMSQFSFARYLNVGQASVKRWETYFIQDQSQDELIRLKCDAAIAEMNFLSIYWKRTSPGALNGNRNFSFEIFKNIALYLIKHTNASIIYLNKLHFYVDFLHYKNFQTSLSGARYSTLKYGPCPDQYRSIYQALISNGYIKEKSGHGFELLCEPDLSLFDDNEMKTLAQILRIYEKMGIQEIYQLSHSEKGFKKTEECSFIDYKFSKDLLI